MGLCGDILFVLYLSICILFASSLETPAFQQRRARLSIDYGPRIIGVAQSNYFGIVEPYGTIRNTGNLVSVVNNVLNLAKTWSVSEIVLGVPLDSNGILDYTVKNFNGQLCLNFSQVLSSVSLHEHNSKFRTVLFDERFTTKEAKLRLQYENVKASIDSMSAACLLERYIEDRGEGSIDALPCAYPPPPQLAHFDYGTVKQHIRSLYYKDQQRGGINQEHRKYN